MRTKINLNKQQKKVLDKQIALLGPEYIIRKTGEEAIEIAQSIAKFEALKEKSRVVPSAQREVRKLEKDIQKEAADMVIRLYQLSQVVGIDETTLLGKIAKYNTENQKIDGGNRGLSKKV